MENKRAISKPRPIKAPSARKKKALHLTAIRLWFASLICVGFNLFFAINLHTTSDNLTHQLSVLSELNRQITLFSTATNSIPQLAEKYGFTLSSVYLQRYWYQLQFGHSINFLNTDFNRDATVKQLYDEIQSQNQELRNNEFHALKLIFLAYHIPNEVINDTIKAYQLSDQEGLMSDADKLKSAEDILYNIDRSNILDNIKEKIYLLQNHIEIKTKIKINAEKEHIAIFYYLLYITDGLLFIFILSILWLRQLHKL